MVASAGDSLDVLNELLGTSAFAERVAENLAAYRAIASEIRKLRELDLANVHPVVVFDPVAAFKDGLA